ncbi:MAG: hypothetical protein LJE70_00780 [Chromatiaceae bacterium]|jgi:hypothetical protein|nr:hypothetical protein [Chromatiaceae bacterium]
MKFAERLIVLVVAVMALSGCIKVDQTMRIKPDGSGTLDMVYGMSEQTIAQLEAMKQMATGMQQEGMEVKVESDSPFEFDEAVVRKKFADKKLEGVELLDVSSRSKDGWKFMELKLAFDDLESLKKTDLFEDSGLSITKNAEGNYVLEQKLGSNDMGMSGAQAGSAGEPAGGAAGEQTSGSAGGQGMDAQMMEGMAAMFAGLRVAMTVMVPGKIIESNATKVDGNRASWIFDIEEDPQVLSKLQSKGQMRLVFSGEGLNL